MCVYLKHFLYLYIVIKGICVVAFTEDKIRNRRLLGNIPNATCESRGMFLEAYFE